MNQAAGARQAAPANSAAVARIGPWTVRSWGTSATARSWVTVACTRCGAVPCDEPLGMYAGFDTVEQAREGLPRDWGWLVAAPPGGPEQVLCPGCAAPFVKETPS